MNIAANDLLAEHTQRARQMRVEDIDVVDGALYRDGTWMPYFERLRAEDPVHYFENGRFGPNWAITKFEDIMEVEKDWRLFSSDVDWGGVLIWQKAPENRLRSLISSDPPSHSVKRKAVQTVVHPRRLQQMDQLVRERTIKLIEDLPLNETFNWVEKVSIPLTTLTLATIFGFPMEHRHLLTHWSEVAFADLLGDCDTIKTEEDRAVELNKCLETFLELRAERRRTGETDDLLSILTHSEAYRDVDDKELLGNLITLIVGGNETTRSTMSGSVLFLNQFPEEARKLRQNPDLINSMVCESIRFQSPALAFRRTATRDTVLRGKQIKQGDRLVLWYVSGNRDSEIIENPDQFIIDRDDPRKHVSFGGGVHRCVGNRVAEMQLRILWEELLKHDLHVEVVGEPRRPYNLFVHGYTDLPVQVRSLAG
jgi:cytochrome P450